MFCRFFSIIKTLFEAKGPGLKNHDQQRSIVHFHARLVSFLAFAFDHEFPSHSMKIAPYSKFLLIGDSITDAGRDPSGEPTPWNRSTGLGHGYVAYLQAWLDVTLPAHRIRVINRGVGGNTILDLEARWTADVLEMRPDWLSVCIGINDVWRQFDCPLRPEKHVLPEQYEATYRRLLSATRPRLQGLLLLTPYVIDGHKADPMRRQMDRYGAIVRQLAGEFDALLVDTQECLDRLLEVMPPTELAWDRIHPGPTGHMALTRAVLQAIGCP